eukprot:Tamp_15433.p1 GENE.Tamp_15433~~Tamp_15433.p1  ORF type:complete len:412 (+),score=128.03 Tamp_15433:1-1236(+)
MQGAAAVALSCSGYLAKNGRLASALQDGAPQGDKVLAGVAGACTLLLSARFAEYLVYETREDQFGKGPIARVIDFFGSFMGQEKRRKIVVNSWIDEYNALHKSDDAEVRNSAYAKLVNSYYELATLFYEVGWGSSFHFSYRMMGESFAEGIRRHEYYLASFLGGLKPGSKVLDVGCGIGGPYRNIARFTGWNITGITLNEHQVQRGNTLNKNQGLAGQCQSVQGDFMKLPFPDASFDGVYAIEATCHAPHREGVYSEIKRVLKPGAIFACYEWCLTDKFQKGIAHHDWIKKKIEEGDGLPDMLHTSGVDKAIKEAGLELVYSRDMALDAGQAVSWYKPLTPSWNPLTQRFQFNFIGLFLTTWGLRLLEFLYLAPKGTSKIQVMLQQGGMGCAQGGVTGTFTPMYLVVARKK